MERTNFICEFNFRKRISALLRAFHLEFSPSEPVSLTIKSSKFGWSPEQTNNELQKVCLGVKQNLKIYSSIDKYHSEVLISSHLTEEQLRGLHIACDCFVSASYGEAICLPILDALATGNQVVASNEGGPKDILKEGVGYLVGGRYESVFGMMDTFSDLYTGREEWFDISVNDLRKKMRKSFEDYFYFNQEKRVYDTFKRINRVREYSYENIGTKIKELLCHLK
jgi:glycosyltransferase involved in cell wall biosynthesis